jgi:molecular chaperone DnaK (HSP70)
MAKLFEAIIEAKIQLSAMEEAYLAVPNILPGQHLDLEVTRAEFEQVIQPHCERIHRIVNATLAKAQLRPGDLDRTIMIGGSSRIPIMKKIVFEETETEPWANADPDLAVCRGAAFLAAMDDGRLSMKKEIIIEEATSHSLGIRAAGDKFAILIPANRPAPVQATKIFTTNSPNFQVIPYQGSGKLVTDDTVVELKPIPIRGVELGPDGSADVKITFSVNEQQLLYVEVQAPGVYEQCQMEF